MSDAKELFSEAIIADMTNDTMSAGYQFELLFEALLLKRIKLREPGANISREEIFEFTFVLKSI